LLWLAIPVLTAGLLLIVLMLTHHRTAASLSSIVVIAFCIGIWNLPDKWVDEIGLWSLGAKAENAIGELLNELRSEGFIVMHDMEQAGEGNVDHLVSGPTGVFMIESKAKGYQPEALRKARRQAAKLHDELDNWVVPVICIHERDREPFRHEKVWIVPEQHLLDWIRARHDTPVPFEHLARWADTLPS
jgi:hypothetical protein